MGSQRVEHNQVTSLFLSFLQRKLHYLFQDKKHDFELQSSNVILQKNSILFIHRLNIEKKIIIKYCYYILKFINWKFGFLPYISIHIISPVLGPLWLSSG